MNNNISDELALALSNRNYGAAENHYRLVFLIFHNYYFLKESSDHLMIIPGRRRIRKDGTLGKIYPGYMEGITGKNEIENRFLFNSRSEGQPAFPLVLWLDLLAAADEGTVYLYQDLRSFSPVRVERLRAASVTFQLLRLHPERGPEFLPSISLNGGGYDRCISYNADSAGRYGYWYHLRRNTLYYTADYQVWHRNLDLLFSYSERPFTRGDTLFVGEAMESDNLSVECPPERIEIVPPPPPVPALHLRLSKKPKYGTGYLRFRYGNREIDRYDPWAYVIKERNDEFGEYWIRDFTREKAAIDQLDNSALLDRDSEIFFLLDDYFYSRSLPELFEKGFIIYITEEMGRERLLQQLPSLIIEFSSGIDWLDIKLRCGGVPVKWKFTQSTPFAVIQDNLYLVDRGFIEKLNRVTAFGREHNGKYRFNTADFFVLDDLLELAGDSDDPGILRMKRIREGFSGFHDTQYDIPKCFHGRLRDYQVKGYRWLRFLDEFGLGGILADDMGLGKTVQALALIAALHEKGIPGCFLVTVPVSTLGNWVREINRFVPDVPVTLHYGSTRYRGKKPFRPRGILLTSYSTLLRDVSLLNKIDWNLIIYDEVQKMKNHRTKINKAARTLNYRTGIALSGTPVENNIAELWAVMETVMPGLLGNRRHFMEAYRDPGELKKKIQPFILRRTKDEAADDLPEREEIPVYVSMKPDQEKYYLRELETGKNRVMSVLNSNKPWMKKFIIISTLNKLRLIAIDSSLKGGPFESGKLEAVEEMIRDLTVKGKKVLVFSQFVRVLRKIEERIHPYRWEYAYIDGAVRNRDAEIKRFQTDPDCRIFLISLRAGGLGINLTAADYVILIDPWWNLSPETQAVDRAHRIGRTGKVTAYRFITRDTVEEKIRELQDQKKKMIDNLFSNPADVLSKLTREEIIKIFS